MLLLLSTLPVSPGHLMAASGADSCSTLVPALLYTLTGRGGDQPPEEDSGEAVGEGIVCADRVCDLASWLHRLSAV